jgi:integrase
MGKLTDIEVRKFIKAGNKGALSDGDGLALTLSAAGTAVWVLRFRMNGKQREKTLGRYPDMTMSAARKLAAGDRVKVGQGVDVAREKQIIKRENFAAWTVRQLVTDYEAKAMDGLAAASIKSMKQRIRDYVLPALGHLPVRDVTGADVVAMLETTADTSPKLVKPVLGVTRQIFAHGLAKKINETNPSAGITAVAMVGRGAVRPKRDRIMLSDAELRAILPALGQYGRINELIIRILLATAVRTQALHLAEWEHIDFDKREWLIPAGDGRKSKRDFTVPITETVSGYFAELRAQAGSSRYVLPVQKKMRGNESDTPKPGSALNPVIAQLCKDMAGKCRAFTPHDLRSTARSHLAALGIRYEIAERCLNHAVGSQVAAIYDQHDYLTERRAALEKWSAKLQRLEAPNVIELSTAKAG